MWYVDVELWCMYLLLAASVGVAVWASIRSIRQHSKADAVHHLVSARRIAIATWVLTAVAVVVTFLTGSTQPLVSNGAVFADTGWLRLTDMFINTALVLVVVAAICVAYNRWQTR